ncbi:MAG: peptide chain release factor N(5)-glutamine methyltransferase [Cellulosilyticaceae bacterium]
MNQDRFPVQNVTVNELIKKGENILDAYRIHDAAIDARLLARHLLGYDSITLVLTANEIVPEHIKESYMYLIAKRSQGIPLQYITKEQDFMGLSFYVDDRVLIPRQDTETLVEAILTLYKKHPVHNIVEIGTGSGCISIALAHYLEDISITAIDISSEALDVAKKNAKHNNVQNKITFMKSDLMKNYVGETQSVDLIVSNPPYISLQDCKELMREVRGYEPMLALTDGADGLSFYRKITEEAALYLAPNGILAYEIGYDQGQAVSRILEEAEFGEIEVIRDLAGKDRVVIGINKRT